MIDIKRGQGYSKEELDAFLKASKMDNRSRNYRWTLACLIIGALVGYKTYKKYEKSPIEQHKEKDKQPKTKKEGEKK